MFRRSSPDLNGSVSPGEFGVQRRKQLAQIMAELADPLGSRGLQAETNDPYSGSGNTVSIEGEAETTLRLQADLDQQVTDENLFDDPEYFAKRGLPPCKRVSQDG